MESAVTLYDAKMSLQANEQTRSLSSHHSRGLFGSGRKVRYFEEYRETQDYKTALILTADHLKLSKSSVTSYLPYEKGVYFPGTAPVKKISVGAERQRRYRAVMKLRKEPTEEHLWEVVFLYSGVQELGT